jgi:hypothetical protein
VVVVVGEGELLVKRNEVAILSGGGEMEEEEVVPS